MGGNSKEESSLRVGVPIETPWEDLVRVVSVVIEDGVCVNNIEKSEFD